MKNNIYYTNVLAGTALLIPTLAVTVGLGWLLWRILMHLNIPPQWVGLVLGAAYGVLFLCFLLLTVRIARLTLARTPRLILTHSGITDATMQVEEILWVDVAGARLQFNPRGKDGIWLTLREADKYQQRRGWWNRIVHINWLSSNRVAINLALTRAKPTELLAVIKAQINQNS